MVILGGAANFLTPEMSVGLNESQNYIWNTQCDADCLGEGTFGKVYRGLHKKTGDKVAVKTFKHVNQQVSQETRMLQSIKHQYIIQLIGIEVEEFNKNIVMIMELCNGGSLMNFLNEPENTCGLQDSEFLLLFEHLSGGLEYLKRQNVIHRDVKPDNIMRHVLDDGRPIYKLADFGTARELPEGQNFYSLHGTEPYLNPQMFKVCFFRDSEFNREFGADTDLWSIGVTLYQTATCTLPFMVQERQVMLTIYNEMKNNEGIISAFQRANSNEVVFQKKLPQTCRLSFGLQQLIVPIIAGLFIQDSERQWSFTQYYEQVLELISRKPIDVFYVNKMQMLKVYVMPDDTFSDFKYYIYQQTEVGEENQVFLYKQNLIVNSFEDFPCFDADCLFLFDRGSAVVETTNNTQLVFETLSNFPTKFMSGTDTGSLRMAHVACRDLCIFKNMMDYQSTVYKFFCAFIRDFNSYCLEERRELQKVYDMLLEKYADTNNRVKILEKLQGMNNTNDCAFVEEFETKTNNFVEQVAKLFNDLDGVSKTAAHFNTSHDSYLKIVVKELSDMKSLTKNLFSAKVNKKLYDFEKIKVVHCVRTIMEIFTDKMDPNFDVFIKDMKDWYKSKFFSQVRALSTLKKLLHKYKSDLKRFEEEIDTRSDSNLQSIGTTKPSFFNKQKLLELLSKYKDNNMDVKSIIEENLKLAEKMNELIQVLDENGSTDL